MNRYIPLKFRCKNCPATAGPEPESIIYSRNQRFQICDRCRLVGQELKQGGKADPAGWQQKRSDCRLLPQVRERALMGGLYFLDQGIDCLRYPLRTHECLPLTSLQTFQDPVPI